MKKWIGVVFVIAVMLAVVCGRADAQVVSVSGRVADPQGGGVVGAVARLTSASGRRLETRTRADGTFTFDQAGAGVYTLQVEAPGFARWVQSITVGAAPTSIDVMLRVAGVNETVSVREVAPATLAAPTLTGTRLGLSALETPASVFVLSGETIRERGDQTVADAKTRAVGVTMQGDPGNGGGAVVARGFGGVGSVMQLFDGDQLFVGAGTVTFPFDPWTVDRIEVLGGPASVLYGNGAIGGVVNVVPRRPDAGTRASTVRLGGGSFGALRAAVDTAGPINSRTSYRVDLSSNRSSGWVTDNDATSTAVSASVRHELTPTLSLLVSEDFGYQRPGEYFGAPTINGAIDRSRRTVNYNVGDAEIWYRDNWTQAKLEWRPSARVRVRTGLHLLATNRHWRDAEEYVFNPQTNLIERDSYIEILHRQRQYGQRSDLVVTSRPFNRSNTLSVGVDYNVVTFQHTNNSPYGGASVTDRDNTTPGTFLNLAGTTPKYRTHTNHSAVFVEDRLALSTTVSLVGGFRFDRYAAERLNLVTSSTSNRTYTPGSWRGGVVYAVAPGVSLYGQVATATDTIGDIISNNPSSMLLDPTTGRQLEAGIKQSLFGQRVEWTVAGYGIVKKKLLASVPGRPGEVQQIGSQSSRGVEATATLRLRGDLRLEGNLAVLDARFDDFAEEIDGVLVSRAGKTPPSVPERTANLWMTWDAPRNWQFRAGLRSVGRRYWDNTNTTDVPSYTVIDAGVRKRLTDRIAADLHLYNITDTLYATDFYYNGFAPQWMLGAPRAAEASVTIGF